MPAHASRTLAPAPSAPPSGPERRLLAPVRPRRRPASAATPAELSASPAARPVKLRSVDSGFGGSNVDDEPFNATTLLQEPRASAGGGGGARLLRRGDGRGGPPPAALGRPLQRGRDAAGGVGLTQELPSAGRAGAALVGRWAQRGGGLPGAAFAVARRTSRAQTRRRGSTARDRSRRRSCATWATSSARTVTGWWWTWS